MREQTKLDPQENFQLLRLKLIMSCVIDISVLLACGL